KALAAFKMAGISGEVVVSDNGSVDGSIEAAREHVARVVHGAQGIRHALAAPGVRTDHACTDKGLFVAYALRSIKSSEEFRQKSFERENRLWNWWPRAFYNVASYGPMALEHFLRRVLDRINGLKFNGLVTQERRPSHW